MAQRATAIATNSSPSPAQESRNYIDALSSFVTTATFEQLPAAVTAQAEVILLDTLGALLSAASPRYAAGRILLEFVRAVGGTPECALIGSHERTSCVNAALYNGTLGYYSDIEAHHPAAILHAAAITVPTALALAERQGRSGADLLTALVLGIDVGCRVSNAIGPQAMYNRGQHPTAIAGCFASATAAGYLLGLDAPALCRAWGLAGTQASGLLAWETDDSETSRPFNPGIAARNGTTAALLASLGFGGPPDIFEGKFNVIDAFAEQPRRAELTQGLGERFLIDELAIKRYASCAFTHPGLDALDQILVEEGLEADAIDAIRLRFPRSGVALIDDNPLRSHNGSYVLAIYALERKVIIDDILLDRRGEPAVAAMAEKIQILGDDELDPEFPERYTTIVEVESNGHTFRRQVPYAKGCPENPLSAAEVEAKFRWLAGTMLDAARVETVIQAVGKVASAPSIDELLTTLRFRPA